MGLLMMMVKLQLIIQTCLARKFSIIYTTKYLPTDDTIIRNITFENNENKIDFDRLKMQLKCPTQ